MAASHPLLDLDSLDTDLERYLAGEGEIFRAFRTQDSGCTSVGVRIDEEQWFVKYSAHAVGVRSLRGAERLASAVRHPALPPLRKVFAIPDGLALVYPWMDGEVLYSDGGTAAREDPSSAHVRFRALPVPHLLRSLETIYDLHLVVAAAGFIAVDFYDGSIIYDFERGDTWLCDLDEYRPGPFVLDADRLPGSTQFMAPEEWRRGARIDQATNVFTLGRTAQVLMGGGEADFTAWRGTAEMCAVVERAVAARDDRYASVSAFVGAWRAAARLTPGRRAE